MTKDIFEYSMLFKACMPVLVLFGLSARLAGQWSSGSGGAVYYKGGNVGIGTTRPSGLSQVYGRKHSRTRHLSESISPGTEISLFNSSTAYLLCVSTQLPVPAILLFSGRPSGESIRASSGKGTT